jgi:hypothetical protein
LLSDKAAASARLVCAGARQSWLFSESLYARCDNDNDVMAMMKHNPSGLLAAVAAVLLTMIGAAAGSDTWHTLIGPEHSFTADLPAPAQYTSQEMQTAAGTKYTMHQYLLEQGSAAYVVHTTVYPSEVDTSNPKANLAARLESTAKTMQGGKWTSIDWSKHQGLVAVDAIGGQSGHAIRSYSLMHGSRLITLTYAGPAGSTHSATVDRFIASLTTAP